MRAIGGILILAAGLAGASALAATDPLHPPASDPCAQNPDYVPGVDAEGNPVPRADIGAEKVPVPGTIAVPLRQGQPGRGQGQGRGPQAVRNPQDPAYVALDGPTLDRLVNPVPCHD